MDEIVHQTIAMETYARRSKNYLSQMVDKEGLPYFNIFLTDPVEAAHDWPDFGDVMSRQLQAAIMVKHMTGEEVPIAKTWYRKILSYIDSENGLLYRPETNYSKHIADPGDSALTLYTLVTAWLDTQDDGLKKTIIKMVNSLLTKYKAGENENQSFLGGFGIKSLMVCARYLGYSPALELAGKLVKQIFDLTPLFTPDNNFKHGGHMHGNLRCLVGAADYALYVKEPIIYSRVDALYRYVRGESTKFGFLPEAIGRKGDIVTCETCAIMDYIGLATTLANHGHPEYWGDVERVARNHLIESQLTDGSWLTSGVELPDSQQFTWRDIGKRMIGGYAGWSSPNHFLGAYETLNTHWGGNELRDKIRAFQNCCGGSGTHAFFEVWKNASRYQEGCLSVNMHIDKLLPQAEIRCYQPYQGLLTIKLAVDCRVRVRIPEFNSPEDLTVETTNGRDDQYKVWGNYIELGERKADELIKIGYPLPIYEEEISIGNPGFRHYDYRVMWKGDTVIKMEPLDNDHKIGYSEFDHRDTSIFYGKDGLGTLYKRDEYYENIMPVPAQIHEDKSLLDFWYIR